jgi:hypothetical protein
MFDMYLLTRYFPSELAYAIDRAAHTVVRFDLARRTASVVVREGDGGADGVGDPWLLTAGELDVSAGSPKTVLATLTGSSRVVGKLSPLASLMAI